MATVKKPAPSAAPQAAPAAAPETAAKSKGGAKKLLIPLLALALAGGGGWYYMQQKRAHAETAPVVEKPKPPVFLPIDQFTVNLSGGGGDRFLQIAFTLQVEDTHVADDLKLQMPIVRSRLLLLLASKTADELATTEGKHKLIGELLAEARAPLPASELPGKGVDNVLFSAFVIQ